MAFLNPAIFKSFASPGGDAQMDAVDAAVILPVVLNLLQLRRTMATKMHINDKLIQIG